LVLIEPTVGGAGDTEYACKYLILNINKYNIITIPLEVLYFDGGLPAFRPSRGPVPALWLWLGIT
jgi:hypothetical protein